MAGKSGRPSKWTARNREAIRERLNAGKALKRLREIEVKLDDFWTDLTPAQVAALKLDADMQWKKLDKLIPSPKALEIAGEDGAPISIQWKLPPPTSRAPTS